MPGRPGTLPWNFATFSGNEPVTTLSDNFSFLNNQINDSGIGLTSYAVDTGTANNLIVTLASAPVAYEAGMMVCTKPAFTSTGTSVINVNALGNIPIVNPANIALQGGEISKNQLLSLVYDGTSFRIIGPCPLSVSLGTIGGSSSVNCAGSSSVAVTASIGAAYNLSLINLDFGVPVTVWIQNLSGSTLTFALFASQANGTSFTGVYWKTNSALIAMSATGVSMLTGTQMIASGSAVPISSGYLAMVAN